MNTGEVSTEEWNEAFVKRHACVERLPAVGARWRYRGIGELLATSRDFLTEGSDETHRIIFLYGQRAFGAVEQLEPRGREIARFARRWSEIASDVGTGFETVAGALQREHRDLDSLVGIAAYRSGTGSATGSGAWEEATLYAPETQTVAELLEGRREEAGRQVESAEAPETEVDRNPSMLYGHRNR